MSRNGKIILGVLAGVLVLCLCVAVGGAALFGTLNRAVISKTATGPEEAVQIAKTVVGNTATGPEEAAQVGHQIANYSLPAGWKEQFGMHLMGFSMVAIEAGSPNQHVMLMQIPANTNMSQAAMEDQLRKATESRFPGSPSKMTVKGSQTMTVRGQQVNMTVSEGTNSNGQRYRSLMGVFQGENGQVMLAIAGPIDGLDETNLQSFIDSIR